MIKFQGRIDSVIFENDHNFFKILSVTIETKIPDWIGESITVTGSFGDITLDSSYEFTGTMVDHERFGEQFRCEQYRLLMPHEESSIVRYLSSENFPGIGRKSAELIVDELGIEAIDEIKSNPQVVDNLDLSKKQKETLKTTILAMDNFSDVILELTKLGLTKRLSTQIYQKYQGDTLNKIKDNPYILISSITGYRFKTADIIGKSLGFQANDPKRIQGSLLQILQENLVNDGSTYMVNRDLLQSANELVNSGYFGGKISFDEIALQLNNLQEQELVLIEGDNSFLVSSYKTEWRIAELLNRLTKREISTTHYSESQIKKTIKTVESKLKISYDETQKQAIIKALSNPIFLLTGGPGTGKTTIISGILLAFQILGKISDHDVYSDDSPFLLAAPTGRAAKRMTESTGIGAKTIHRLLGIGRDGSYDLDDLNELNGEVLIVDEMSMVDMQLFKTLISAIDGTKHIIFVGDRDQLPSVGPGNIFADLIDSTIFPTTKLQQIHRQAGDSSIIDLAYGINNGDVNSFMQKSANTSFIPCAPSQIQQVIPQIVNRALSKGFKKDDLQVLGAMYKTSSGVDHLNELLQNQLNPLDEEHRKTILHNDQEYRINDRVLQLVNNPEKDIYNGQIGKVIGLNPKKSTEIMTVDFDGHEVNFSKVDLNDITLAYAITIHKSQGSEFPVVILSLTMQNYRMLRRNLLYTGVTRARDFLILVGEEKAMKLAIQTPGNDRNTALGERLNEVFEIQKKNQISDVKSDSSLNVSKNIQNDDVKAESNRESDSTIKSNGPFILTKDLIVNRKIDPLIGMENITLK